ncbi:hypothetical protein BH09BAC4_BH09BAC4_07120 [soil metagenome]
MTLFTFVLFGFGQRMYDFGQTIRAQIALFELRTIFYRLAKHLFYKS